MSEERLINAKALEKHSFVVTLGGHRVRIVPLRAINRTPTANAELVVYADWIEEFDGYRCSKCETHFTDELMFISHDFGLPPRCPRCGAHLRAATRK